MISPIVPTITGAGLAQLTSEAELKPQMQISFDGLSLKVAVGTDSSIVELAFLKGGEQVACVKDILMTGTRSINFSGLNGKIPIQVDNFTKADIVGGQLQAYSMSAKADSK